MGGYAAAAESPPLSSDAMFQRAEKTFGLLPTVQNASANTEAKSMRSTSSPSLPEKLVGMDEKDDSSVRKPKLQNVRATDYATPPQYLDDPSKIPSYYVFQSNMVTDEDLVPGMLRNLEVDRRLTVPTRTHIRFLITGGDVIHSFAVPSLGIKADAVPGRLQRINCFILREGVFYGQCSELCGALHGFMPIVVEAVSPATYAAHAKKFYRE
ncbi:putative cytochrome C oxidase subunit IIb [Cardiosporidium cionae]|uniref:Cytochrome c oxidase polypeptide II n=1 Tax=Cardiosporidium cionae TaxID=476202 RepID=A0ABQ7J5H8_9APIC|nr:putative cytochrome C oxidase subunit IIb [Cardiosporidium cionae]|eukprot:KAF8819232.1 putative cytochrome C oxidase subunit IIb [Cardiosporidium cionae]